MFVCERDLRLEIVKRVSIAYLDQGKTSFVVHNDMSIDYKQCPYPVCRVIFVFRDIRE